MTVTVPEFSRPVRADTLGEGPRSLSIEADEGERAALARRFGLPAIGRLVAEAALAREGADVRAAGTVQADVSQRCVATGEAVPARLAVPFDLLFRRHVDLARADEEIELDESELDVVFYDGASVDIGEAVAETLLLNLDPYPRAPGAEEALKAAGVKSEDDAGPFAALAGLRDKLKK